MKNRLRPYTPLHVKIAVAERQYAEWRKVPDDMMALLRSQIGDSAKAQAAWLKILLCAVATQHKCEVSDLRLDHTLALRLRSYNPRKKDIAARYTPNANDPAWLAYLPRADHDQKTFRRNGAQFSDTLLIKRDRRRENRELGLVRPKKRWLSRPFPKKGRGFEKRP